jgi:hypothetical protein
VILDKNWETLNGKTFMEVFSSQFNYIIMTSKISRNREAVMSHSDQQPKVQAILTPLLDVINEMITGPCSKNQNIFLKFPINGICALSTRVVDDLNHDYHELSMRALNTIISLTEGNQEAILQKIASKLPGDHPRGSDVQSREEAVHQRGDTQREVHQMGKGEAQGSAREREEG